MINHILDISFFPLHILVMKLTIPSILLLQWSILSLVEANPKSRPYVAYRGNPFDQEIVSRKILEDGVEIRGGGGR